MFAGSASRLSQEGLASLVLGERTKEPRSANHSWLVPASALRLAPVATGYPMDGVTR